MTTKEQQSAALVVRRTIPAPVEAVYRAWTDPAYKRRLLENGTAAIKEFGHDMGALHLVVVENTPETHNMIVCTLCSCYPRAILGLPPSWYKSREYRARAVRDRLAVSSRKRRSDAGRAGSGSVKSRRLAGDRTISMRGCLGRFGDELNRG